MTDGALIRELGEVGFTEVEARVYVALAGKPPMTVYQMAQESGVPRPNAYGAIERLVQRQAVQPVGERPARYVAIPPRILFDRIAKATGERCSRLTEQLEHRGAGETAQFVFTVFGRDAVEEKINGMIRGAESRIWFKATDDILDRHVRALRAAARRGVPITIVLFGNDPGRFDFGPTCQVFLHDENGIRLNLAEQLFTVVRDGNEALIANVVGDFYGVYTESLPVVRLTELLLRKNVYLAEIMRQFGPEIDAAFGPLLADLRRRYLFGDELERFEARLAALEEAGVVAAPARNGRRPARKRAVGAGPG